MMRIQCFMFNINILKIHFHHLSIVTVLKFMVFIIIPVFGKDISASSRRNTQNQYRVLIAFSKKSYFYRFTIDIIISLKRLFIRNQIELFGSFVSNLLLIMDIMEYWFS